MSRKKDTVSVENPIPPEAKAAREQLKFIRDAFNGLSPAGRFEALRFMYLSVTKDPRVNEPPSAELQGIKAACDAAENFAPTNGIFDKRSKWGLHVDTGLLAQHKDVGPAFQNVASRFDKKTDQADFGAFILAIFGGVNPTRNKPTAQELAVRSGVIVPMVEQFVDEGYKGLKPSQAVRALARSDFLVTMAEVDEPRLQKAIGNVLDRVDATSSSQRVLGESKKLRERIALVAGA